MTTRVLRKIVKIDEAKCNGCGLCVPACAEGAIQIIGGKAKLVSETYCDGLGACLGECPQDAITIEEREAEEFSEEATARHLEEVPSAADELPCGCPGTAVRQFDRQDSPETVSATSRPSLLNHWPVQLTLVPPAAPFLQDRDLVLAADCVPFAYAGFHERFLQDHALLVACPKLDDFTAHQEKLTQILRRSRIKSLTIVHMEVPCCSGLVHMTKEAVRLSGKDIPLDDVTIGIKGDLKS